MAERTRTTKKLAQRIDLNYFKRSYAIPRWKRLLSVAAAGLSVAWLGWAGLSGKQSAFNAGPLAHGHTLLTNNCAACHVSAGFSTKVTGQACLACHDAPAHQANQTFTPDCNGCHAEHQGAFRLAATGDAACTRCHSNLKTTGGTARFAAAISSFSTSHPEFASVRTGHAPDPGTVKLSHQVHLKSDLKGPNGPVQLLCVDCHSPASRASNFPMAAVDYARHCAACHPLAFDARFTDAVPHRETRVVHDFVARKYTEYIAQHPAEMNQPVALNPELPSRPIPPPSRNASEWVAQRVEEAERLLWQKSCKECHAVTYPVPGERPEIPKSAISLRWMMHAKFNHAAHQLVACTECHTQARTSNNSADVLLPGIATCQKCHTEGRTSAESRCSECHEYHDWTKAKPASSARAIADFAP